MKKIILVGYSGGGAVAALVAAQRKDISRLITVAGNLDHHSWTKLHGITPLSDSLNPVDYSHQLQNIPQLHLVGGSDKIIPPVISESYRDHFETKYNQLKTIPEIVVIPEFGHSCCWEKPWPALIY